MCGISFLLCIYVLLVVQCMGQDAVVEPSKAEKQRIHDFFHSNPYTNNWAVIISASRYWFNYRHTANALGIYYTVKRMGLHDSKIILMLADDYACNARNPRPAQIFGDLNHRRNLYTDVEVDYRGYDVNVDNILRLLLGRHPPEVPMAKRLLSDSGSNILFYMTGHGGHEFLKIQDHEEINSQDLGDALHSMHQKNRYRDILFLADTCEAATLSNHFYSPNIIFYGSSSPGENSYSLQHDYELGVSLVDRFTHHAIDWFASMKQSSTLTLANFFSAFTYEQLASHGWWRNNLHPTPLNKIPINQYISSSVKIAFTEPAANTAYLLPTTNGDKEDDGSSGQDIHIPEAPLYHPHKPPAPHNMPKFPSRKVNALALDWKVYSLLGGFVVFIFFCTLCCYDTAPPQPTEEEIQEYKKRMEQLRAKEQRREHRRKTKAYPRLDESEDDSSDDELDDFQD